MNAITLKRYLIRFVVLGFLALAVTARAEEKDLQAAVKSVNEGNQAFAIDMYRQLVEEKKNTETTVSPAPSFYNIVFSPYSISSALAMTYAGAGGNTEKEMAKALHFTLPQDSLHPTFAEIRKTLESAQKKGDLKLSVANSLWPDKSYSLNPIFLETARKNYETTVTPLNFKQAAESAKTINQWVEKNTNDKIKDLLQPDDLVNTVLVLVNAIYFKGDWKDAFPSAGTREEPFWVTASTSQDIFMMHQETDFPYFEDDSVQVLEKPYKGEQLFMQIILPIKKDGLADVEKSLTSKKLAAWTAGERQEKVIVAFPKFKMEPDRSDLVELFKSLGMKDPFDPMKADFLSIFQSLKLGDLPIMSHLFKNAFISHILHKAFIEVEEKGTEAAASTAVVMTRDGSHTYFKADHPFLFLIRERSTGTILFMGRLVAPEGDKPPNAS